MILDTIYIAHGISKDSKKDVIFKVSAISKEKIARISEAYEDDKGQLKNIIELSRKLTTDIPDKPENNLQCVEVIKKWDGAYSFEDACINFVYLKKIMGEIYNFLNTNYIDSFGEIVSLDGFVAFFDTKSKAEDFLKDEDRRNGREARRTNNKQGDNIHGKQADKTA